MTIRATSPSSQRIRRSCTCRRITPGLFMVHRLLPIRPSTRSISVLMSPAPSSALALALRWQLLRDSAGHSVVGALVGVTAVCCTTAVAGIATAAKCATGALRTEDRAPSAGVAATVVAAGDAVTGIAHTVADLD